MVYYGGFVWFRRALNFTLNEDIMESAILKTQNYEHLLEKNFFFVKIECLRKRYKSNSYYFYSYVTLRFKIFKAKLNIKLRISRKILNVIPIYG